MMDASNIMSGTVIIESKPPGVFMESYFEFTLRFVALSRVLMCCYALLRYYDV